MRTLAIGDIHGCNTALTSLLKKVSPDAGDQIIFLGDYIDRGPASKDVINTLIEFSKKHSAVFLRGNHEVMILDARLDPLKANLWQSYGGFETLQSYNADYQQDWTSTIPGRHWDFLKATVRYFETSECIFVHANLDPDMNMDDQPDWLLFWEFFDRIKAHKSGKRIVCGHSPQRSGLINDIGYALCIDTGAAVGGWLICLDTTTGKYWQANEQGETRELSL